MSVMLRRLTLLLAILSVGSWAAADVPPSPSPRRPDRAPKQVDGKHRIDVQVDDKLDVAQLILPKDFAADGKGAAKTSSADPSTRSIIAGLALALAAASVLLIPRWKRSNRFAAATIIGVTVISVGAICYSDLRVPGEGPRARKPVAPQPVGFPVQITIDSAEGRVVTLKLSPAMAKELAEKLNEALPAPSPPEALK